MTKGFILYISFGHLLFTLRIGCLIDRSRHRYPVPGFGAECNLSLYLLVRSEKPKPDFWLMVAMSD